MARAARALSGELRGQIDDAAERPLVGAGPGRVLAVGREGLETALFLWSATEAVVARTPTRPGSRWSAPRSASPPPSCSASSLPRRDLDQPEHVLHLDRRLPDPGRRRRPGVRRPRPPGGRRPARPAQPGVRRLRHDRPDHLVRHPAQGHLQLLPADHRARGRVWVLYVVPVMFLFLRGARRRSPTLPPRQQLTRPKETRHMRKPARGRPAGRHAVPRRLHRERQTRTTRRRGDARTVAVTSTDDECEVSAAEAPSGTLTFNVTNDGSQVTEFYLLGEDGLRIVGEVENIGPQPHPRAGRQRARRQLRHRLQAGHEGRRHPRRLHGHRVRRGAERLRRRPGAGRPGRWPTTRRTSQDQSDQLRRPRPRSSSTSTRPATTTRPARCTPRPACTGSGSRPSPSRSATSTR